MTQLFSQMRMSCESFGADQIPEIIYYSRLLKKVSEKSSWAKCKELSTLTIWSRWPRKSALTDVQIPYEVWSRGIPYSTETSEATHDSN
jgi:hypothetical protein